MKEYSSISKILSSAIGVKIVPKMNVKIQKVTDFRAMLKAGVDFTKMKRAVLIGEALIV
jgi:hypothetical protein